MERPRMPLIVADWSAHLVRMTTEAITTSGLEPPMSIDDLAGYLMTSLLDQVW